MDGGDEVAGRNRWAIPVGAYGSSPRSSWFPPWNVLENPHFRQIRPEVGPPARAADSEGSNLGCAKKKRKLHAVREMREGPSKPLCRERLQTATSCCDTMVAVVNVVVKSVDRPRDVWMRETNASEPPLKHRNLLRRRQNRGLRGAPGSVWWKPVYWPDGVRCIGGVTLIQAFVWNLGT